MRCPQCRGFAPDDAARCPSCGADLAVRASGPATRSEGGVPPPGEPPAAPHAPAAPRGRLAGPALGGSPSGARASDAGTGRPATPGLYPWRGSGGGVRGGWFQRAVTWLLGHLWAVLGGLLILVVLARLGARSLGFAADLAVGLLVLAWAVWLLWTRGVRRLPAAVLLGAVAVAVWAVGLRARHGGAPGPAPVRVAAPAPALPTRPAPAAAAGVGRTGGGAGASPRSLAATTGSFTVQEKLTLPQHPVYGGVQPAGGGAYWLFEGPLPPNRPDQLQRFEPGTGALSRPVLLPAPAGAFGTARNGDALAAYTGPGGAALERIGSDGLARPVALPAGVRQVLAVAGDPRGGVWVVYTTTRGATDAARLRGSGPRSWQLSPGAVRLASDEAGSLAVATDGTAWLLLPHGLLSISPAGGVVTHLSRSAERFRSLAAAPDGTLWILTYPPAGSPLLDLVSFQPDTGRFTVTSLPGSAGDAPSLVSVAGNAVCFGFGAVGGAHGVPGEGLLQGGVLWVDTVNIFATGIPGGAAGSVWPLGGNRLLVSVPFSGLLLLGGL
jgi:hypothetical protein